MIKCKIHRNWYLWALIGIILIIFGFIMYILKSITFFIEKGFHFPSILIFCLFLFLELFLILVFKDFKYIIVYPKPNQIKYYSILHPFGKKLTLSDYECKIKTTEFSIQGDYEVIHLVNKKGYTAFKISGLFYKNFKEIDNVIQLKRIHNYKFNWKLYLKLIFTGKMKVEKE